MTAEATQWLYEQGIRIMGIDAWGWDVPLDRQAKEALNSGQTSGKINRYILLVMDDVSENYQTKDHVSFKDLENDKRTSYAVIRCLEVLGEAVKKIPNHSI